MNSKNEKKGFKHLSLKGTDEFNELLKLRTMFEVSGKSPHMMLFYPQIEEINPDFISHFILYFGRNRNGFQL